MAAAKRLAKQHLGGMANFAGSTFESYFGIWRVLRAVERLLVGERSRLALQLKNCHVDDWVEDLKSERHYFQLKRMKRLSWASVRTEFVAQQRKKVTGKTVKVSLVAHTQLQAARLWKSKSAVPVAEVVFFPGSLQPQKILEREPVWSTAIAVCVEPTPTRSDLEAIWSSIDFAWQKVRKPGKFVGIGVVLDALPDQNFPPLRRPWVRTELWRRAERVLLKVPGLSLAITDGHFTYSDGAGTKGRLSCRTSAFRKFANRVLTQRPKTLDAVWDLL